jgi:hypothetical protein
MKTFFAEATYQKLLALICIPLMLTAFGGWACTAKQQQTIVSYVGLAVDTCSALSAAVPAIGVVCPVLQTAQAGLDAWVPGNPVPQNVIAALQAALPKAEAEFPGITSEQKDLIAILVVAIEGGLTIAGVATVSRKQMASNPYAGLSPKQLRQKFNSKAKAACVPTI